MNYENEILSLLKNIERSNQPSQKSENEFFLAGYEIGLKHGRVNGLEDAINILKDK